MTEVTRTNANPGPDPDLGAPDLPSLTWSPASTRENLDLLYGWAQRLATESIDWYLSEKKRKARWSRLLRAMTAVLATIGGAIPVAALASGRPSFASWGYVVLVIAAGCIGYDRYFGYSSAWQRYLTAAIALRGRLIDFRLVWAEQMAQLGDRTPQGEDLAQVVRVVQDFVASLNQLVESETDAWLAEFSNRLNELETGLRHSTQGGR